MTEEEVDEINSIDLLIGDYQCEIDELERDIDELDTRKDILVRKLDNLLESVVE
ncbi:hypothetical protein Javan140_0023 [Streptococcus phage Javan140]|nr:hypothetical protein Javan140_0023 [Streptococcus phage Javan140]